MCRYKEGISEFMCGSVSKYKEGIIMGSHTMVVCAGIMKVYRKLCMVVCVWI